MPIFGSKGASVHVREMCSALDRLGHEVLIVSPRLGGERPNGFAPEIVEITAEAEDEAVCALLATDPAAGRDAAREIRALTYAASQRARLRELLRDFDADAVFERYALLSTTGGAVARSLGVPHLLEVNAPLSAEQSRYRGLAFVHTARTLERAVVLAADRVLAVSEEIRRWLGRLGAAPERIVLLPNAVDPERFATEPAERAAVRIRLGLGDSPVIVFVGTLKPWHDVASLVHAIAQLTRAGLRLRLVVVGDGPERARLETLAAAEGVAPQTVFVGAVAHEEIPQYLAAADAAAVTYAAQPGLYFSPLKLFEYMAAGVPVVAADAGDIGHCIVPGETGVLYPAGDTHALAERLLELIADPNRAAEMAGAARRHTLEHHTWASSAATVARLVDELRVSEARAVAWA